MKKTKTITIFLLVLSLMVLLIGCGGTEKDSPSEAVTNTEPSIPISEENKTSGSAWFMATEVDEFGDVVNDSDNVILKAITNGDFSNTATNQSDLRVEMVESLQVNHLFYFRLLEYNRTPATYYSSSTISMKVKVENTIKEYTLVGSAPNGPVFLGYENSDGNELFNTLYAGYDVKCIIYIDNSQYNFTIPASGFKELCVEAQIKLDEIEEKNRIKDNSSLVNNLLSEEDGSSKLKEAYEYLRNHREEYDLLTDSDIKSEISGDYYYVSLKEYKDNGIIITYRYVMNYSKNKQTQKLYFKDGVGTEEPVAQNTTSNFTYKDGVIDTSKPCQLRKIGEGYYAAYASDGTDYTIPSFCIMKGHQASTGFIFDYPTPK